MRRTSGTSVTFSSWHPLFVSDGAYGVLGDELHRRGLKYCNTDGYVTASVAVDPCTGTHRVVLAHRDPGRTAEGFSHPEDRSAYLAMLDELGRNAETVFGPFGGELRSLWVSPSPPSGPDRRVRAWDPGLCSGQRGSFPGRPVRRKRQCHQWRSLRRLGGTVPEPVVAAVSGGRKPPERGQGALAHRCLHASRARTLRGIGPSCCPEVAFEIGRVR